MVLYKLLARLQLGKIVIYRLHACNID